MQQRDEIRQVYIKVGSYQLTLFPDWLEYSPTKNATFCLPCFLFNKSHDRHGLSAFTVDGFRAWKKVNDGKIMLF